MGDEWPLCGRGQGHVTYFKFWDPLRNFLTGKARHFVFSSLDMTRRVLSSSLMNDSLRGRGQGHVTCFLNFGTFFVTFERVKLDTSFFSLLNRPRRVLYVTYFLNFKYFLL